MSQVVFSRLRNPKENVFNAKEGMDWLEKVRANNQRAYFFGILLTKAYLAIISKPTYVTYISKRKSIEFS